MKLCASQSDSQSLPLLMKNANKVHNGREREKGEGASGTADGTRLPRRMHKLHRRRQTRSCLRSVPVCLLCTELSAHLCCAPVDTRPNRKETMTPLSLSNHSLCCGTRTHLLRRWCSKLMRKNANGKIVQSNVAIEKRIFFYSVIQQLAKNHDCCKSGFTSKGAIYGSKIEYKPAILG